MKKCHACDRPVNAPTYGAKNEEDFTQVPYHTNCLDTRIKKWYQENNPSMHVKDCCCSTCNQEREETK